MESVGLGGPKRHGSSWQRGIAESGSSQLSTLMIDVPGDLVWDLPCVQQASYLEGGPLMWMLPLYLHVNQKSDYDMIYWVRSVYLTTLFLVQAQSSIQLTSTCAHSSARNDNCPSCISGRERMIIENISWSISMKECCRIPWGLNPRPPDHQSMPIRLSHQGGRKMG